MVIFLLESFKTIQDAEATTQLRMKFYFVNPF